MKIIMCSTLEQAKVLKLQQGIIASVEAEYGKTVVKGDVYTLAHHVEEYRNQECPCLFDNKEGLDGTILVSHADLDTIGGCLAIMGKKPLDGKFWATAAYIDLFGPHKLVDIEERERNLMYAWLSWSRTHRLKINTGTPMDVSDYILEAGEFLTSLLSGNEKDMINRGIKEQETYKIEAERRLVFENEQVRAFITEDFFCSAAYFSDKYQKNSVATVSFNSKYGTLTLAFSEKGYGADKILQSLFGSEAGGRDNIAGCPRGQVMTKEDFNTLLSYVKDMF